MEKRELANQQKQGGGRGGFVRGRRRQGAGGAHAMHGEGPRERGKVVHTRMRHFVASVWAGQAAG